MVCLTVSFGNTRYFIQLVMAEQLYFQLTIGIKQINEQLVANRCLEQRVKFREDIVIILGVGKFYEVGSETHRIPNTKDVLI